MVLLEGARERYDILLRFSPWNSLFVEEHSEVLFVLSARMLALALLIAPFGVEERGVVGAWQWCASKDVVCRLFAGHDGRGV